MNLLKGPVGKAIKPLFNIGLGQIPGVQTLYKFIWKHYGPKGIRLTEVNGFKLWVVCRDWAVAPTLMFAHVWEPAETEICKQHIKEGMTVIDAGAYIGYYSLLASKLVGSKGKVYSFEPSPECLALLRKNIQLNGCGNVEVFGAAASDRSGGATFYLSPYNLSGSTMFDNYSGRVKDPQIEVPTVTLDEVIGDERVDFVKMDIEGGETQALRGMTNIIRKNPNLKMIIEVFPAGLVEVGSSLVEYIGFLQQHFHLRIIERDGLSRDVGLWDIQRVVQKTAVINLFCQGRGYVTTEEIAKAV